MSDGWKILNRKVDDYDDEWSVLKDLAAKYWHWFVIHLISAEIFRWLKFKNISLLFFIVGSFATILMYNWRFYGILMTQTMISYVISSFFKKKRHVWILAAFWLFILNILKFEKYFLKLIVVLDVGEIKIHDFLVIFAWGILKNVSFNLERNDEENKKENFKLIHCLGYVFYFPTFHTGPHMIYSRYMHMLNSKILVEGELKFYFLKSYKISMKNSI